MIPDTDKAYIAGLFDGEGSIYFLNVLLKRKRNTMVKAIEHLYSPTYQSMEITMTDESVIRWVHEVLGVGTVVRNQEKVYVKMEQILDAIPMALYI